MIATLISWVAGIRRGGITALRVQRDEGFAAAQLVLLMRRLLLLLRRELSGIRRRRIVRRVPGVTESRDVGGSPV